MPKDLSLPLYRVKAQWNGCVDEPLLLVGCFETSVAHKQIVLPFDLGNKELYSKAKKFAVWVNQNESLPYRMEFNQQYFYNDVRNAKRDHYQHRPLRPAIHYEYDDRIGIDRERDRWQVEYEQRLEAEEKAKALLITLTSVEFAEGVQGGHPFYFESNNVRYIIDPSYNNLIRLDPDCPRGLCVYLADPKVQQNKWDWAIAIYLYLKGAQQHLHDSANEYRYLRHADWRKDEPSEQIHDNVPSEGMMYLI